ncbi:MAG: GTP-binding protein, partial [Cyanobacteria bacterium J06633_1]
DETQATSRNSSWLSDSSGIAYGVSPQDLNFYDIIDKQTRVSKIFPKNSVHSISIESSPTHKLFALAGQDVPICLWDPISGKVDWEFSGQGNLTRIAHSTDGKSLAAANDHDNKIQIWNIKNKRLEKTFRLAQGDLFVNLLSWSPHKNLLVSGSTNSEIHIWDMDKRCLRCTLRGIWPRSVVGWSPNGNMLALADTTQVHLFNLSTLEKISLEGHTQEVRELDFSFDSCLFASSGLDNTLYLRNAETWEILATLSGGKVFTFHPLQDLLATFSEGDTAIRVWDIDKTILFNSSADNSVRYTTAKIVLVGDSGVGKTGLGWRLAHNDFKEHASTHGQQFWVINDLCKTRDDGTECEAVLWDLAGQPDYRLVHSLFLDAVDTALVLFDPTNRQEPLSGVDFWLNQLNQKEQALCNSILVGARIDRGISTLTNEELQAYCERNNIQGSYIPTSAATGDGIPELLEQLQEQIPWDKITATVTTQTFKHIKEYVLALKEQTDRTNVLVHPEELRAQLQASDTDWEFSNAEMMTAVGHLANHGYVTIIQGSQGNQSILLAPDLLANLAASIVLEARRNPRGLGVLEENRLLTGDYHFPELHELEKEECESLLDAATVLFLDHNLCFREIFNQQTFLVFPSLINEKRPRDENLASIEGASYQVKGAVETVYASMVVLLGYTNTFIRTNQWQNQAQYEVGEGEICGFQQTNNQNGEIALLLYYGESTPESVKLMFRGMFERFLSRRDLEVSRYQPVICIGQDCGAQLARNVVIAQLNRGRDFSFCNECGTKLRLPSPEALTHLSKKDERELDVQQTVAKRRTNFETALVRVKALLRDRGSTEKPTCFISYAWGISEHERWVLQLAKDLRNADIDVLLDRWHSLPGSDLSRYIDRILESEFVIVVG